MGHLLNSRYVWAGELQLREESSIYVRQRAEGGVDGDLEVSAAAVILDEECALAGRGRSRVQL